MSLSDFNIIKYNTIDSTNKQLKSIADDAENGCVIVADRQTAGRGRFDRKWESSEEGAWFSILVKDARLNTENASCLVFVSALAVCETIIALTGNRDVKIKWPNDIVLNGKKLAGILCESGFNNGRPVWTICGIGINLNQTDFPEELPHAASVFTQTGIKLDRDEVVNNVLLCFEKWLNLLFEKGTEFIVRSMEDYSATLGKDVKVVDSGAEITGKALRFEKDGSLAVLTYEGIFIIRVGDVSVRGIMGYV